MVRADAPSARGSRREEWRESAAGLIAVVIALALAAAIFAFVVVPSTRRAAIDRFHLDLAASADLREAALDNWLADHKASARIVAKFPSVLSLLEGKAEAGAPGQLREILADVASETSVESILVISRGGLLVASSGAAGVVDGTCAELAARTAADRDSVITMRMVGGSPRIVATAPVFHSGPAKAATGAVLLVIDPEQWVYPFVRHMKGTHRSAEAVLVQQDGDSVRFVSPLDHRTDPTLSVRRPLSTPDLAARAALEGREKSSRFIDYRGVPVIAATRTLANAPWGLIVKVDEVEVLAEGAARAQPIGAGLLLAALLAGVGASLIARARGRAGREARQRELERLALVLDATSDAVLFIARDGTILDVNSSAERMYGRSRDQLRGMSIAELRAEAEKGRISADMERISREGRLVYRTTHRHAGGASVPVEVSSRVVEIAGHAGIVSVVRDITERIASEELIRAIVESAPASIHAIDRQGRVTLWNPESERKFGWSASEVLGTRLPIVDEAHAAEFLDRLQQTMSGVPPPVGIVNRVRKDGSRIDLLMSVAPLRDSSGLVTGALAIAFDVTEARETEQRARALFASGVIGSLFGDIHGRVYDANDTFLKIIGYSREELRAGMIRWDSITPDEWLPLDMEKVAEARRNGRCAPYEKAYVRKDGTVVDVLVGFQLLDPERERSVAFILDISELKREQQARRVAESALGALFETPGLPIVILDADGDDLVHVECNKAYAQRLGRGVEQVIGHSTSEFGVSQERIEAVLERVRAVAASGNPVTYELEVPEDGRRYVVSVSPLPGAPDSVSRALLVMTDVTALRVAEAELRRLNFELEKRVAARTEDLVAANRELEAFSYSVSHDLRAPLRAIDGFSRLVEEGYGARLDDEGRRLLGVIRGATRSMAQLIDDLLTFSQAGRQPIRRQRVPMEAVAMAAWNAIPAEQREGIRFELAALPDAIGDASLIRQVWQNLLANAVKYSAPKSDRRVEAGSQEDGDRTIWFVRDNGIGFEMKYAATIFETFQRLHSSREFEGTGVGLAIARRIVNRHGGEIWGEGKPGVGASLYFTLGDGTDS
ncbi:MAG: PAS domain S-box protein [Thermoanaerobaculia bacterium]